MRYSIYSTIEIFIDQKYGKAIRDILFTSGEKNCEGLQKAKRLQLFSNRPDERLFNNRIWLPITRNSWAGRLEVKMSLKT